MFFITFFLTPKTRTAIPIMLLIASFPATLTHTATPVVLLIANQTATLTLTAIPFVTYSNTVSIIDFIEYFFFGREDDTKPGNTAHSKKTINKIPTRNSKPPIKHYWETNDNTRNQNQQ